MADGRETAEDRPVGEEARKSHAVRLGNGFVDRFLSGSGILDIGYKGYLDDVVPIVPGATGIDFDYPGYDGVTLPFPDLSQDAVFASHCLEHITDFRNALRDWFRVLRTGGFLIVMVPHKFLYEKKAGLPSNFNADHKRFYTPGSLLAEIESSLVPNSYRLRHLVDNDVGYDYAIPPERHSGGCYEIELVIEKIAAPDWELLRASDAHDPLQPSPSSDQAVPARRGGAPLDREVAPRTAEVGHDVVAYDFGRHLPARPRILVLKLDHLGDFIIGLPALRRLRAAFASASIHLVVGSWNRVAAEASGLADEVGTYDYFPQNALGWDGSPSEPLERLGIVAAGAYDIAIDLRVDDDTRFLLDRVDAGLRCGIGSRSRFSFLDVALPPEHEERRNTHVLDSGTTTFGLEWFESRMPAKGMFFHETDFRPVEGHVIFGPNVALPRGSFTASFALQFIGSPFGLRKARVTLDIARGREIVAIRQLRTRDLRALARATRRSEVQGGFDLAFENDDTAAPFEFRVFVEGQPLHARLRFAGVRLDHAGGAMAARFRRAELHVGEQLSLLVQLLQERTAEVYGPAPEPAPGASGDTVRHVVIAPLSNSDLRDWPAAYYARLIQLLVDRLDCRITLVGSGAQAAALEHIRHEAGRDGRVTNLGGKTPWSEMPGVLRRADLVVCNNSGIAHLAGAAGALTLAIYSASHQPQEWGPRGARSHALMAVVPCSPCGHDRLVDCPNEHTCMRGLLPDAVFQRASILLDRHVPALLPGRSLTPDRHPS